MYSALSGIGPINCIEKEHETDQCPIDARWGIAFGEEMVTIDHRVGWCDLGCFQIVILEKMSQVRPARAIFQIVEGRTIASVRAPMLFQHCWQ
jgi:hypothetical protein